MCSRTFIRSQLFKSSFWPDNIRGYLLTYLAYSSMKTKTLPCKPDMK